MARAWERDLDILLKRVVSQTQRRLRSELATRTPVDTSNLRRGWQVGPVRSSPRGPTTGDVSNRVHYVLPQMYGTGPIHAKRAPFLHFRTRGGQWVRTKSTRGIPRRDIPCAAMRAAARGDGWDVTC